MKIESLSLKIAGFLSLALMAVSQQIAQQSNKQELYTIEEAQECFHSQALPACQQKIQTCLTSPQCQQQLLFFQDCNFERQYPDQIFNGNCFKNWKRSALSSKDVIQCIDSTCNLAGYNSQVSLGVLYSCTTQALMDYHTQCNQNCQEALKNVISRKVPFQPITKIYHQNPQIKSQLRDQNAERIIQIINKECISEEGATRKRHQSEILQKKQAKQRMHEQMNQRPKIDSQEENKVEL